MNIGSEMFLLAAEELSFSRAAERAFVTQQCLSDHIKRLEENYHVTLFQRKPFLKLTPAGESMRSCLQQIQILEHNMASELSDISSGTRGIINFGVSSTRGNVIIPQVIPKFQEKFPDVDVQIQINDTYNLEQLLLRGKLDLFLGVNPTFHGLFRHIPITEETIYLAISDQLLRKYFSDSYKERRRDFSRGADMKLLEMVPFVAGHNFSTTTYAIKQFLFKYNFHLKIPIAVSNFDILLDLCDTGQYATLFSEFQILRVMQFSQFLHGEQRVWVFPVKNLDARLPVNIVAHRNMKLPAYTEQYIHMLREFLLEKKQEIQSFLEEQNKML